MAEAALAEKAPELLKIGLDVYKELKNDMQKVLGLSQYAKHMAHIVETMNKVNKHLDEEDKKLVTKLTKGKNEAEDAMTSAQIVINNLRSQLEAFVAILRMKDGNLATACEAFAQFVKDLSPHVEKALDRLTKASGTLEGAAQNVDRVLRSLERVQSILIEQMKAAQAKQRAGAYGGAAAGALLGPLGLIISYSVAAGICEGKNIPDIEKDFKRQRQTIEGYEKGFVTMKTEARSLQTKVNEKKVKLLKIHGDMSATGSLAAVVKTSSSPLMKLVEQQASDLLKSLR
jgi:uncharacterized phage infection (PIP) family protein YhgE